VLYKTFFSPRRISVSYLSLYKFKRLIMRMMMMMMMMMMLMMMMMMMMMEAGWGTACCTPHLNSVDAELTVTPTLEIMSIDFNEWGFQHSVDRQTISLTYRQKLVPQNE